MAKQVTGYSSTQLALHWAVVVLIAFQYLAHAGIEATWRSMQNGGSAAPQSTVLTYLHIAVGSVVLLLAFARLLLRVTRGVPAPPADEPHSLKLLSDSVHWLIYVLLFALPISGLFAWLLTYQPAATLHVLMKNFLLLLIVLHIAGALFQHFFMRSEVLIRIFSPQR